MLRRRPLMRAAATTAVVAGTATAVSGRVSRRQQAKADQAAEAQAYQEMQAAPAPAYQPAPPPPSTGMGPDVLEQLKELGALHEQGILTDEEFSAQKAKLLA